VQTALSTPSTKERGYTVPASWLIRWDTAREAAPRITLPDAEDVLERTSVHRLPDGSFFFFDGYLFDRDRYVDDAGPGASPAAIIAAAYRKWGDGFIDRLRGGYSLAIWDAGRRRMLIGRDALGLSPCYYSWANGLLAASASQDTVLAEPEVGGRFNRPRIAEYLIALISPVHREETFYEEVRRLPPAHTLSLTDGALRLERYWDPVPPGFEWASGEESARLGGTFERAVERCLAVGADSLALSGGFDSVSVAVVAAEQRLGRPPLHAVSMRFTDTDCDEGDTQMAVARTLGMPQVIRSLRDCLADQSFVGGSLALSGSSPTPVLSAFQSMYTGLLESATDRGLRRMMMGTGGDDTFNVDFSYGADLLASGDLAGLWRFYRLWQRTSPFSAARVARVVLWHGALKPEARQFAKSALERVSPAAAERVREQRRRRALPAWLSGSDPTLADSMVERRLRPADVELVNGERSYVRTLRRLTQSPLLMMELDQGYSWAERLGKTLLYPYFDRDMVELTLRMHPDALMAGGRAKAPLRELVAERLPSVPMRSKKVDFGQAIHGILRRDGKKFLQQMGGAAILTEMGIVDPRRLDPLLDEYFAGADRYALLVWLVLSTEMWLRERS